VCLALPDIVLQTAVRETDGARLHLGGGGIPSAVTTLLLSSSHASAHGVHGFLHSTGFVIARNVVIVLAVVFWLALDFWVFKDARRRVADPFLVLLATLLGLAPPYIGPVVYLLFRPSETIADARARRIELRALEEQLARSLPACPVCVTPVETDYLACPVCTTMLRQPCRTCNAALEPLWQMCPYCASPIEPSQVDLDAALTAEARTIALVDDSIPLVPQPEARIADA
jgi:double zinc ribbon protein